MEVKEAKLGEGSGAMSIGERMRRVSVTDAIAGLFGVVLAALLTFLVAQIHFLGSEMSSLRAEMSSLRGQTSYEISSLRGEMKSEISALRGEMKSEISALRGEMKSEISALRGEMKSEISALRGDIMRQTARIDAQAERIDQLAFEFSGFKSKVEAALAKSAAEQREIVTQTAKKAASEEFDRRLGELTMAVPRLDEEPASTVLQ